MYHINIESSLTISTTWQIPTVVKNQNETIIIGLIKIAAAPIPFVFINQIAEAFYYIIKVIKYDSIIAVVDLGKNRYLIKK